MLSINNSHYKKNAVLMVKQESIKRLAKSRTLHFGTNTFAVC